jgi:hypothetical protein
MSYRPFYYKLMQPGFLPSLVMLSVCVQAATYTWDGGGNNNNWNQNNNWNPDGAPGGGDGHDLIFAGTSRLTPNASGGNWTVNSLTFNSTAGAFTIGGGVLTLGGGGVTSNSTSTQTINNQFTLAADQTWTAASGAIVTGTAYFNANGKDLTLAGSSAITLNNQIGNVDILTTTGSGNRTFGTQPIAANTVSVQSTGTNSFGAQMNVTTLNVSAGTTTFANVQAGSGGINVSGAANANFTGPVAGGGGSGITLSGSGNIDFSGSITSGTLTLTSAFTGTATLSGTGAKNISSTVVSGGTLVMDQAGGGDAINGSLTINDGGTVLFTGDNQVPAWQTVYLNEGSTLLLGDTTQTFTNLIITGDSVIDFGGSGSQLNVSSNITIAADTTITILNWNAANGDAFTGSNPGNVNVTVQYADNNGNIYATGSYGGGGITPGTPVPEPAAYGLLLLGYGAGVVLLRRPRRLL